MEPPNPPLDPINRTPQQPENVLYAKNYNVNAAEHDDFPGEQMLVILQAVDGPESEYTVALPFSSQAEVEEFISELNRMKNLIWPTPGDDHANGENGNDKSVDSPALYGKNQRRFRIRPDEPDQKDPG